MKKNCKVCGSANRSSRHRMNCLKGTKFVRTAKKSCANLLRLPSSFARKVGEFLQNGALLYANDIDVTRVEVVHSNGGCSFGSGWPKFYENFKVTKGAVLLFKYLGYSAFKVCIFHGYTGLQVGPRPSGGSSPADRSPAGDGQAEVRKVGRPRVLYQESEEVGHVELYGMKLRRFTKYNLRAELRRRRLEEDGCKAELVERLGRFIMRYEEKHHYERVRIGQDWGWV